MGKQLCGSKSIYKFCILESFYVKWTVSCSTVQTVTYVPARDKSSNSPSLLNGVTEGTQWTVAQHKQVMCPSKRLSSCLEYEQYQWLELVSIWQDERKRCWKKWLNTLILTYITWTPGTLIIRQKIQYWQYYISIVPLTYYRMTNSVWHNLAVIKQWWFYWGGKHFRPPV